MFILITRFQDYDQRPEIFEFNNKKEVINHIREEEYSVDDYIIIEGKVIKSYFDFNF